MHGFYQIGELLPITGFEADHHASPLARVQAYWRADREADDYAALAEWLHTHDMPTGAALARWREAEQRYTQADQAYSHLWN